MFFSQKFVRSFGIMIWLLGIGVIFMAIMAPEMKPRQLPPIVSLAKPDAPWNNSYQVKGYSYRPMSIRAATRYREEGWASWYGNETYSRPGGTTTASGEAFHPEKISAAHRTLPLPSKVRVTNLENGRELILRVNDRGPFPSDHNPSSGDRVIDLSAAAAKQLGFYGRGVARVRVEAVG